MRLLPVLLSSFYALTALAQTPQDDWTFPSNTPAGATPTIVDNGQRITIAWIQNLTDWFPAYSPNTSVTDADLWITGYDLHQYEHLVASAVDVLYTSSVTWLVNLPADEVEAVASWVFRFIQRGLAPSETQYEISSAYFIIRASADDAATTSATSSPTPTTTTSVSETSATSSATDTAAASSNTSSSDSNSSSGLSTGAKAGIGVGAALGGLALLGLIWFCCRRSKKQKAAGHGYASHTAADMNEKQHVVTQQQQQVPPSYVHQPPQELSGENQYHWNRPNELGGPGDR